MIKIVYKQKKHIIAMSIYTSLKNKCYQIVFHPISNNYLQQKIETKLEIKIVRIHNTLKYL